MIRKTKNSYIWQTDNDHKYYSFQMYGKYAKKLAELSEKNNRSYLNYITTENNITKLNIYSEKYGYVTAYIDKEDVDLVQTHKWGLKQHRNTFYCHTTIRKDGKVTTLVLHRIVTKCPADLVVDHDNKNGLDNRKRNLKITTPQVNSKNRRIDKDKKDKRLPVGIIQIGNSFEASWYENYKQKRKTFNITELGWKLALKKAIRCRYKNALREGYNVTDIKKLLSVVKVKVKKKQKPKKVIKVKVKKYKI